MDIRDTEWRQMSGYYDCCGMSRLRRHADLCPKELDRELQESLKRHDQSERD